ncbi:MAG: exopolysaccharide biosynthesis polyprenyl glycosylphosphotransferase [Ignavibacteriaceae bacterium]|nr:exopolysaccharide biosynthesis polyprenyl glycosylphosphotransferase [Ignavibacteriaceae bacterium]
MIVNQRSIFIFKLLSDLILLNCAFIISAVYAQSFEILLTREYMFYLLVGLNLTWLITSNYSNFYDDFYSRNFPVQFFNILKNSLFQLIITITFIFLVKENLFTRYFIVYYFILLVFFISFRVIVFRKILKLLRRKGKNIRNMIIIGDGELAQNFKSAILSNPDYGFNFKGFISENIRDNQQTREIFFEQLEKTFSTIAPDEAVIAIPEESRHLLEGIIKVCDKFAIKVHIIPDYYNLVSKRFELSSLGDFPIITARREPLNEVQWRIVKRAFDLLFSLLVTLLILSWLLPLIFIFSVMFDKGPVFFLQDRLGTKNKKFRCIKFRTMKHEENKTDEFNPATENDPRITKIGRILRKYNLDELPQFINVFLGDMSVVGPRPHAISYDELYGKIVDEIRLRHNVKPGITGWAQIHGLRGDVIDENENRKRTKRRIDYDIWYIENWSFWLDIQIILLTVWQMIVGKSRGT